MDELSDLEHIRSRPAMYIGDTTARGLHHIFHELLDNSVDQFLAGTVTKVRATVTGRQLEFADDGPGLPFEVQHESGQPLATYYLSELRRYVPTADGHTPHVHLAGWGCGLRIVSALSDHCEVTSARGERVWRQSFAKGIEDGPAESVLGSDEKGTIVRVTPDSEIFRDEWNPQILDERLTQAAYLFPGLVVETPTMRFCANRGLADWATLRASELKASAHDHVWWFNNTLGNIHIQAALAGHTEEETEWHAFANGNTSVERGSHYTALRRAISACKLNPAVAMIHVIMQAPKLAGPTRTKLDAPEIVSPIYQALKPDLADFVHQQP